MEGRTVSGVFSQGPGVPLLTAVTGTAWYGQPLGGCFAAVHSDDHLRAAALVAFGVAAEGLGSFQVNL